MDDAAIDLDFARSGRSSTGLLFCGVVLRLGSTRFPTSDWVDFAELVLGWWIHAAMDLVAGRRGAADFRFMEGPYVASVRSKSSDVWSVSLIEDGLERRVLGRDDIRPSSLLSSLVAASERILSHVSERQWISKDTEELRHATASLRAMLKDVGHAN